MVYLKCRWSHNLEICPVGSLIAPTTTTGLFLSGIIVKSRKFRTKKCLVCCKEYTPNSSSAKYCSECREEAEKEYQRKYIRKYYITNKETILNQHKDYNKRNLNNLKKKSKEYRTINKKEISKREKEYRKTKKSKDIQRRAIKKWRLANPEKHKTQRTFGNATRDGKIKKQHCEVCGNIKVEGHHPDYSKPLEIEWLCRQHHLKKHQRI